MYGSLNKRSRMLAGLVVLGAMLAASAPAYGLASPRWMRVDKLHISMPAHVTGHDSFAIQGSFNMPPATVESTDVSLVINNYSITIPKADWKRAGSSNVINGKNGHLTGHITFWVNGTSKCLFTLNGSLQPIRGALPDYPNLPVTLLVGPTFSETLTAVMPANLGNGSVSLKTLRDQNGWPLAIIDKLTLSRTLESTDTYNIAFQGTNYSDTPFDPTTDDMALDVGDSDISIYAGTMQAPAHGKVIRYKADLSPTSKVWVTIDNRTGKCTISATNVPISNAGTYEAALFAFGANHVAYGPYAGITMHANKKGTVFTY